MWLIIRTIRSRDRLFLNPNQSQSWEITSIVISENRTINKYVAAKIVDLAVGKQHKLLALLYFCRLPRHCGQKDMF